MARRLRTRLVAICVVMVCLTPFTRRSQGQVQPAHRLTLDDMLIAYRAGDFDIIKRSFARSPDFQRLRFDRPRDLERWLGSWDRGKALILLELARASGGIAPQFLGPITRAGRLYLGTANGDGAREFVRLWNRAATGLLLGASDPAYVEQHVAASSPATGELDARLRLARGVAQERRCWALRPSLEQAADPIDALLSRAGMRVPDDTGGPFRSDFAANMAKHSECLKEALARFDAAASGDSVAEAADEARVRAGWVLIQDGRPEEAIARLEAAKPHDDRDLQYWHALFLGRALSAADKTEASVTAYKAALELYPNAQSAGLGLAIALVRLYRFDEADEVARAVRSASVLTPDPWLYYPLGDERFTRTWIESLRAVVR